MLSTGAADVNPGTYQVTVTVTDDTSLATVFNYTIAVGQGGADTLDFSASTDQIIVWLEAVAAHWNREWGSGNGKIRCLA